ncbi:MAG: crossover junction endodeoxyribonuclease RuvC [Candidatus Shapirobacteria bacterium]
MILGIDPGLANTGWAILDDRSSIVDRSEYRLVECGCLKTKISDSSETRLGQIYEELESLIKKYKIEAVAIETLFFAKNASSAIKVAEAIGVIKVCGQKNGLEVMGFTPLQVKMALVGYGRAEKEQVEMMVRNFLGLEKNISPSHASDAVAVALTYLFTNKNLVI